MEYLQYYNRKNSNGYTVISFKPCYKWNTFNTPNELLGESFKPYCFKPCYKWNTFNTIRIEEGLGRLSKF